MNAHAADGRRHADARRVRARAVGQHRAARADVPREHEEERVRAGADARTSSTSLTRGLSLDVLTSGHGEERGVPISYQAQSPVLGLVLPSNSPGVHTLWLPIIPMQIGLVLKPGPQEPWTPYRMAEAFFAAGIPREAISIYPGRGRRRRRRARQLRAQPDLRRHSRRSIATAAIRGCRRTARASRRSCSATTGRRLGAAIST